MSLLWRRSAARRALSVLFALALGGRLVAHDCPAHSAPPSAPSESVAQVTEQPAGHSMHHHGAAASMAAPTVAPAAAEHSHKDAPECTCAGDCMCAAQDCAAPPVPTVAVAVQSVARIVPPAYAPLPRIDAGVRLLPFANGPPVTTAARTQS